MKMDVQPWKRRYTVGISFNTSEEWLKQYNEENDPVEIIDPDGWDRSNFEDSWNEKITYKEFQNRLLKSTVSKL